MSKVLLILSLLCAFSSFTFSASFEAEESNVSFHDLETNGQRNLIDQNHADSHEHCEHGDQCVIHCFCHHATQIQARELHLRIPLKEFKPLFYSVSIFYLDPVLDPFLRPPLFA